MNALRSLVVCVVAGLAACGSAPANEPLTGAEPTTTGPVQAGEVSAFHFRSGDLVIGEFDPHTIGSDLFNPCAEISDEEFAAAGFVGKIDLGYDSTMQRASCFFETDNPDIHVGFLSTAADRAASSQQARFIEGIDPGDIPHVYFYEPPAGGGVCFAVVDTVRGAFGASATSYFPDEDVTSLCEQASRALQALYSL
ncbi:DUF3558 family protein [Corynebacterium timonense]|nr:DUF3558 family protein [Corynebacterium timonense]